MPSVTLRSKDLEKVTIPIGFVGENIHTVVVIDCTEDFKEMPNAIPGLSVKPPKGNKYPAVIEQDGNLVKWTIKNSDLLYEGNGEFQIAFVLGSEVGKTYKGHFKVKDAIVADGDAPDPIDDWLVDAEAALQGIPVTIQLALAEAKASGEFDGADGVGISSIVKTGTAGLVDTYTITLTNGNTYTFTVTNGSDGSPGTPGADGFSPTATVTKNGKVVTITITDKTQTTTTTVSDGTDGEDGDDGVGIASIAKTGTSGLVDTYTITLTNNNTYTFTVTNGADGSVPIDDVTPSLVKVYSSQKVEDELSPLKSALSELDDDVDDIKAELITGQTQTYTGVICTLEGQNAGDSIGITPDNSVNKIYHTGKNLFKLFNRTAGTLTGWGASSVRPFKDNEYYNGFISNGTYDGSPAGNCEYITDGIKTTWGTSGGGGGKGTLFPVLLPAGKYTISGTFRGQISILLYDADAVFASRYGNTGYGTWGSETSVSVTFEVTGGTRWVGILFHNVSSTSANNPTTYKNVMLVEGETYAAYEVYEGEVITESISALTAYAGVNKIWTDAGSFAIDTTVHRLTVIEDEIDDLQEKVEVLENDVIHRNLDQLPEVHACVSYGVHSGGVENNKRTIGILVTTDVHNRQQVMQNAIDYLNEYSFLDMGVCLGDITGSYYNDTDGTWYTDIVNQSTKPFYTILGNHDEGNGTDSTNDKCVTVEKAFEKWIEPTLETMGKPNLEVPYYAVHNATYGISMIFLNSYDVPDTKDGSNFVVSRGVNGYSQTQIDWFISELNNVPSTNHLILFQHCNVCDATKDEGAWTQKWNNLPNNGSYGDLIPDIINAWITGGTLSETYTTSVTGLSSITVSADFTSRGVGVFAGHVFGHYHRDIMAHSTKYSGQKLVSLMCTADGPWQNGENDLPRVENTKTQDAITILSVNKTRKTLNLVRVGSTKTLSMTERNMIAISY